MLWKMTRPAAIGTLPREAANPSRGNQAPRQADPWSDAGSPVWGFGTLQGTISLCVSAVLQARCRLMWLSAPSVPGTEKAVTFKTITS